jgi:hypothetical protein
MPPDLRDLMGQARRELRRSSGLPLSPEELAEERRLAETEEMNKFLYDTLGLRLMFPLKANAVWTEDGAAGQLIAEGITFHLRKDKKKNWYGLFVVEDDQERELLQLEGSDRQFGNRVLVAISDALGRPVSA